MPRPLRASESVREVVAFGLLVVGFAVIADLRRDFMLFPSGLGLRTAIAVTPLLCLFAVQRIVLSRTAAFLLSLLPWVALGEANAMKFRVTGEPLLWTDLSTVANLSVLWHYVGPHHLVGLAIGLGLAGWVVRADGVRRPSPPRVAATGAALLVAAPIMLHPYLDCVAPTIARRMQVALAAHDVIYDPWDWTRNARRNGLSIHLIQTSRREVPDPPTPVERRRYASLRGRHTPVNPMPRTVMVILCESCWNDAQRFPRMFDPLVARGLVPFRAISPAYGGGTVNATFELLTGLPARGALTGVIYQEYAGLLRDEAEALPRALGRRGYATLDAHNHYRRFWKRDVVNPKLGFDHFLSLEEMAYTGPGWADDRVLFDAVAARLQPESGLTFSFLTTVFGHGGYRADDDLGEGVYAARITRSVTALAEFIDQLLRIDPSALLLVLGDHKPGLTEYFVAQGLLPRDVTSAPWDVVGDVPGFVRHPDARTAAAFAARANGMPFFCVSTLLDEAFIGVDHVPFAFAREIGACARRPDGAYDALVRRYPDFLYSLSLLER